MKRTPKDLLDVNAFLLFREHYLEGDPSLCPPFVSTAAILCDCKSLLILLTTSQDEGLERD